MNYLRPADVSGLCLTKGHGTENDFVVYADPDGSRPLTPQLARWLCDRRAGIGGDGAIRAVRVEAAGSVGVVGSAGVAQWFMDYRNSDGSLAEMCGNGIRVFVAFLQANGLVAVPDGGTIAIATRGGERLVTRLGTDYSVEMGAVPEHLAIEQSGVRVGVGSAQCREQPELDQTGGWFSAAGSRVGVRVEVPGLGGARVGTAVVLPNPHVVVEVTAAELSALDLTRPPRLTPEPPAGANVEFIAIEPLDSTAQVGSTHQNGPTGTSALGHARLRVHERGSGETRSCGTGVTAAALVARALTARRGGQVQDSWQITVPGGDLTVQVKANRAYLIGPATLVATGQVI